MNPPILVVLLPLLTLGGVWAYALWDFSHTPEREIRAYPRETWLIFLTVFSIFGALMWLRIGRPPRE